MKKDVASNTFLGGLMMDFNPLAIPGGVITNALNATIRTMNGNENALQNDMGNGRVETAYLPKGYIPVGTAELGGIVYIASYNPFTDKSLIGSFPSPERNISSSDLDSSDSESTKLSTISCDNYYNSDNHLNSSILKIILSDKILNPGDKYLIILKLDSKGDLLNILSGYGQISRFNPNLLPRYVKLKVVNICDNGQIIDLNDTLVWHSVEGDKHYYLKTIPEGTNDSDIDEYRNIVQSNYNVFLSKYSGRLGIIAELECINSFSVSYDYIKNGDKISFYFYVNWTYSNNLSLNKINLYGIQVNKKLNDNEPESKDIQLDYPRQYPKESDLEFALGTTDITQYSDIDNDDYKVTFLSPPYVNSIIPLYKYDSEEIISNLDIRSNDGNDYDFLITTPIEVSTNKDENKDENKDDILTLDIIPAMPFGYLDWLKQSFLINLNKLGTGYTHLSEYRYYVEKDTIRFNWGLEVYPERNKNIKSVTFNFKALDSNVVDILRKCIKGKFTIDNTRFTIEKGEKGEGEEGEEISHWQVFNTNDYQNLGEEYTEDYFGGLEHEVIHVVNNKGSFSGHFTENLDRSEYNSDCYLVEIVIDYNSEKTYKYYRILYTDNVFNKYFSVDDFSTVNLQDEIQPYLTYSISNQNTLPNFEYNIDYFVSDKQQTFEEKIQKYKSNRTDLISIKTTSKLGQNIFEWEDKIDEQTLSIDEDSLQESSSGNLVHITNGGSLTQLTETPISNTITNKGIKLEQEKEDSFLVKSAIDINLPFLVLYDKLYNIKVNYRLKQLDVGPGYVLFLNNRAKGCSIGLSEYVGDIKFAKENCFFAHSFGDGKSVTVDVHNNVYPQLETILLDRLNLYDILPIGIVTYRESGKTPGLTLGIGTGTNRGSGEKLMYDGDSPSFAIASVYAVKTSWNTAMLIALQGEMPLLKSLSGEHYMFGGQIDQGWNKEFSGNTYEFNLLPPCFNRGGTNAYPNLLGECFKKYATYYYKIVKDPTEVEKYTWSILSYLDNYQFSISVDIKFTNERKLKINNVPIDSELNIKNLYYTSKLDEQITFAFNETPNIQLIINRFYIEDDSSNWCIKDNDIILIAEGISLQKVYSCTGRSVDHFKYPKFIDKMRSTVEGSYVSSEDVVDWIPSVLSRLPIQILDGRLRVVADVDNWHYSNGSTWVGFTKTEGLSIIWSNIRMIVGYDYK